jgi:hypothetical protein
LTPPPRLLLPHCDGIQDDRANGSALYDLDKAPWREVSKGHPKDKRANDHADEQCHIHEADDFCVRLWRGQIGRKCKPRSLNDVRSRTNEQKGECRRDLTDPNWCVRCIPHARKHKQGERHDRKATKLQKCPLPNERDAPPSELAAVSVRFVSYERSEGREKQRQGDHNADDRCRQTQLDNHDPIKRADQ